MNCPSCRGELVEIEVEITVRAKGLSEEELRWLRSYQTGSKAWWCRECNYVRKASRQG